MLEFTLAILCVCLRSVLVLAAFGEAERNRSRSDLHLDLRVVCFLRGVNKVLINELLAAFLLALD